MNLRKNNFTIDFFGGLRRKAVFFVTSIFVVGPRHSCLCGWLALIGFAAPVLFSATQSLWNSIESARPIV